MTYLEDMHNLFLHSVLMWYFSLNCLCQVLLYHQSVTCTMVTKFYNGDFKLACTVVTTTCTVVNITCKMVTLTLTVVNITCTVVNITCKMVTLTFTEVTITCTVVTITCKMVTNFYSGDYDL